MAVEFIRTGQQGTLYNKGEVASFDAATEKRLIDQKYAVAHKPKAAEKPAA